MIVHSVQARNIWVSDFVSVEAPEIFVGEERSNGSDWWTFGCILYEMLVGLPPHYDQDVQKMYQTIKLEEVRFPSRVSENAKSLLIGLLKKDVKERLRDPNEIRAHPFFKDINFDDVLEKKIKPPFVPEPIHESIFDVSYELDDCIESPPIIENVSFDDFVYIPPGNSS